MKGKVLIISDEQDLRESWQDLLEDSEFEVSSVSEIVELESKNAAQWPDLIVYNVSTSHSKNLQFSNGLFSQTRKLSIPCLLVTSHGSQEIFDMFKGRSCYMVKHPINGSFMQKTISKLSF